MITVKELVQLFLKVDIPTAYHSFKSSNTTIPPNPPFMVYLEDDSNNFGADNKVYKKLLSYSIEVYTERKDIALEKKLEDLLDLAEVYYETAELYISEEKMFQRTYYITVIKN